MVIRIASLPVWDEVDIPATKSTEAEISEKEET